jgi:hypothetical protein
MSAIPAISALRLTSTRTLNERGSLSLTGKERPCTLLFQIGERPLTKPVELPQGTLEMLILKAVSLGPLHGYGILLRIQQISGERLEILQGSFSPPSIVLSAGAGSKARGVSQRTTAAPAFTRSPLPVRASSRRRPPNGLTWPLLLPPFSTRRRTRYESPRRNSQAVALHRATHA